jgi:hypothetical protein
MLFHDILLFIPYINSFLLHAILPRNGTGNVCQYFVDHVDNQIYCVAVTVNI